MKILSSEIEKIALEMPTHTQILSGKGIDSFRNYMGDVLPDTMVFVIAKNRDSDILTNCNYEEIKSALESPITIKDELSFIIERFKERGELPVYDPDDPDDEYGIVYEHEINHWAVGWVSFLFVKKNTPQHFLAAELLCKIENYPVLNEEKFSELEQEKANSIWKDCYNKQERLKYIRENRSQFDFRSFTDLMDNIRGEYFSGYSSELIY